MKFYIAASLSEFELVRSVSKILKESGWIHTYDWTLNFPNIDTNNEVLMDIAKHEFNGVQNADIVIFLNPKGRGTHTELGIALALSKKVYLYQCDDTVSFYWLPQVNKLSGDIEKNLNKILSENTVV